MHILVTGFDPFNGETYNPSQQIVEQLPKLINDATIETMILPTVAYKSLEMIDNRLKSGEVDIVIALGQAGGRAKISLERVAINLNDFSIPDNQGQQYIDQPIFEDGPTAYFSTLPIKEIKKTLQAANYPIEISNTSGTFVCNHLFYGLRHLAETNYPSLKCGFIHIPYIKEQVVDRPHLAYLEFDLMMSAIIKIIECITGEPLLEEIRAEGGLD